LHALKTSGAIDSCIEVNTTIHLKIIVNMKGKRFDILAGPILNDLEFDVSSLCFWDNKIITIYHHLK
jgi:hypothetical protein